MKCRKELLLKLFIWLFPMSIVSQHGLVNMNQEHAFGIESNIYQSDSNFHSTIKPYSFAETKKYKLESIEANQKFFVNKLVNNTYKKDKGIFILPLLSASGILQIENKTNSLPGYSAGAYLKGFFGEKFSYSGLFRFIGQELPNYIDSIPFAREVVPSVARINDSNGVIVNAQHWEAYMQYNPNKYFSFLLGKGKHFWGDGYRSLLLSDNAPSYPYLRIESKFWNVKYINLYSWHNDFTLGENRNKFSTSHFLSWNITKDINFGLFESVIWQGSDTLHNRGFEVTYLNPAIFYRAPEFSLGSADNSMIGANLKFRVKQKNIIYGQLLLDEFYLEEIKAKNKWWANKYGIQIGIKAYDFLAIKNLFVQTEFNAVRPFTYSHYTSLQNYGHNNQSLAHPLGSNFYESTNIIRYSKGNWFFEEKFNYLLYGTDTSSVSNGGDIFASYMSRDRDYNHKIGQGEKHNVVYNSIKTSYQLINEINLRASLQVGYRLDVYNQKNISAFLIQVGISSLIWNEYKDY